MVQGEPWGLHGFFSTFRLAYSNLRQENEEVLLCCCCCYFNGVSGIVPFSQLLYG